MARADAILSSIVAEQIERPDLVAALVHLDHAHRIPVLWGITLAYGEHPWSLQTYLPIDLVPAATKAVEGHQ